MEDCFPIGGKRYLPLQQCQSALQCQNAVICPKFEVLFLQICQYLSLYLDGKYPQSSLAYIKSVLLSDISCVVVVISKGLGACLHFSARKYLGFSIYLVYSWPGPLRAMFQSWGLWGSSKSKTPAQMSPFGCFCFCATPDDAHGTASGRVEVTPSGAYGDQIIAGTNPVFLHANHMFQTVDLSLQPQCCHFNEIL